MTNAQPLHMIVIVRYLTQYDSVRRFNARIDHSAHILYVAYGAALAGYRADVIVVADAPHSQNEVDYLDKIASLRLRPDGVMIGWPR